MNIEGMPEVKDPRAARGVGRFDRHIAAVALGRPSPTGRDLSRYPGLFSGQQRLAEDLLGASATRPSYSNSTSALVNPVVPEVQSG